MLAIAPVAVINITSADDTQTPMMMAFILRPLAEPVGDNPIIDASGTDERGRLYGPFFNACAARIDEAMREKLVPLTALEGSA